MQEGNAHHQILEIVLITLFKDFKGRGLLKLYWDFCIPQLGSRIDVVFLYIQFLDCECDICSGLIFFL